MDPNYCPNCQNRVWVENDSYGTFSNPVSRFYVECFNCGMKGPTESTHDKAVLKWNSIQMDTLGD